MSSSGAEVTRDELSATLAARQELGRDYEPALVEALAERVEQVVQARVAAQVARADPVYAPGPVVPAPAAQPPGMVPWEARMAVGVSSLIFAIPCSAIAGNVAGVAGIAICWSGIAIVNLAMAISARSPRR